MRRLLVLLLSLAIFVNASTISLKVAGARGDGSTDDTAAIQSAIIGSQPGDTIQCPAGVYRVTKALTFLSSRSYQGALGCVLTGSIGTQLVQLEYDNAHDVVINGWTFSGGGILSNGSSSAHSANNITISNNTFQNITLTGSFNSDAIHAWVGTTNFTIQGNTFTNIYNAANIHGWNDVCGAIWLFDSSSTTITQNTFSQVCQAVHITANQNGGHDITVTLNTIHDSARYGIEIQGAFGINNVTVNGNYYDTPEARINGQTGISLAVSGTGHQILNNSLQGPNLGNPLNQSAAIEAMGSGFVVQGNVGGHWGEAQLVGYSDASWSTVNNTWCDISGAALPANIIRLETGGQNPAVATSNIAIASCAGVTFPPPAGTFSATGHLTVPRAGHSATLLANGKVLIAGGGSAELYDPATDVFTATGNMVAARQMHAATLLMDGRVLITGGLAGAGNLPAASAELYDPSTGIFSPAGLVSQTQTQEQTRHTATLLQTGKVLIAGLGANAVLFDPATSTFAAAGPYADPNPGLVGTATLLADGTVLITGCTTGCTGGVAQVYDPAANTFSVTGPMTAWGNVNTATLLANGQVFIAGSNGNDQPADAQLYDPSTRTFTSIGNTAAPHEFSTATLFPDNTVLITGNQLSGGNGDPRTDLYNPITGKFSVARSMTTPRQSHTATLLRDGTLLVTGGYVNSLTPTSSAELYRPPTPLLWQQAITQMTAGAGTDSLNFWQWAWYWEKTPLFAGAPPGFGRDGSISDYLMEQIIVAGGGDGTQIISAEQWVMYYRQLYDSWNQAIIGMISAAGANNQNIWQWAWFWQKMAAFPGAPAGFGHDGSISTYMMGQIIAAGGGDGSQITSAEQWVMYYRLVAAQSTP